MLPADTDVRDEWKTKENIGARGVAAPAIVWLFPALCYPP